MPCCVASPLRSFPNRFRCSTSDSLSFVWPCRPAWTCAKATRDIRSGPLWTGYCRREFSGERGKLPFSPDYFARYNAQIAIAREVVAAIGPHDPVRTIVDVERLRTLLVPVDAVAGTVAARDQVPSTLYLISFLRQFPEFRPR